ncbi:MAG: DNA polymerase III subunit chi [Gammaproteobacteria bacterium]|nr:DNA polymerase III subunit chi [Gammaproteobacteria bacterium]
MTQVDFYILKDSQPQARPMFTCRLTEKAYKQGHQVYIHTESPAQLKQIDDLLWTFRAGSFLPHAIHAEGKATGQPILLGQNTEPEGNNDVLVNLSGEVPSFFSRFSRVVEPVAADDNARAAARERYRYYQDRGYTLNTHKL